MWRSFKTRLAFAYYALRVWGVRRKREGGRLIRSGLEACGYDIASFDLSPIIQPNLSTIKDRRLIGVWAWELERPPKFWNFCAKWFDEIWAISDFTAAHMWATP